MGTTEENKATVRACFENAAQGNFDAFDDILTNDYVLHPGEIRGADGLREMVQGYRDALSGLRVTIDQQFTDGDYVATRFTVTGTHDGNLMGNPPSGKNVAFTGIAVEPLRERPHRRRVGDHRHGRSAGPDRCTSRDGRTLKGRHDASSCAPAPLSGMFPGWRSGAPGAGDL